jgi:hypothetical protein
MRGNSDSYVTAKRWRGNRPVGQTSKKTNDPDSTLDGIKDALQDDDGPYGEKPRKGCHAPLPAAKRTVATVPVVKESLLPLVFMATPQRLMEKVVLLGTVLTR